MKNTFKYLLLVAIVALTFTSCNKDNTKSDKQEDTVLNFNFEYSNFVDDTKATKKGWNNGDYVYLFFKKPSASAYDFKENEYVKMQYNGTTWKVVSGQEYLNNLPEGEGEISALHFTEMGSATTEYGSDYTRFTVNNDYKGCLLLRSQNNKYTKTGNSISANLKFKINSEGDYKCIQLNIKNKKFIKGGYYIEIDKINADNTIEDIYEGGVKGCDFNSGSGTFVSIVTTPYCQPNFGAEDELTFFVLLDKYYAPYTEETDGSYTFEFNARVTLTIKGTDGYNQIYKDFKPLKVKEGKVYNINSLKATDEQIVATASGQPIPASDGWVKK